MSSSWSVQQLNSGGRRVTAVISAAGNRLECGINWKSHFVHVSAFLRYSAVFAVLVSGEESVWVGRRSHPGRALLSYQATGFKNSPALRFCSATLTHRVRLRTKTCRVWRGCWAASPSCCRMTHSLISLGATSFSPDMRFRGFFRGAALTLYKYRCVMIGCG